MNDALDKAVLVFRERGYHATSIADLTAAMKLASGSVYKAFKDKRALFLAAFDRAVMIRRGEIQRILRIAKSGRDRMRDTLLLSAESSYGMEGKRGCLLVGSAADLVTLDAEIAQRVTASLHKTEALIAELIRQGQEDGSIRVAIDREETARLMLCVLLGMRVVGKTGRSRTQMSAVANAAMKLLG